jgi:D-inositol-3-phosphate glycosyltransferase
MNVYVREVGRQLASQGFGVDVFTRLQNPALDKVVPLGQGARVIHIHAGPPAPCDKNRNWVYLPQFCRGTLDFVRTNSIHYDIIHSHYWLSGWAGLRLQRDLGVPIIHMFHTLGIMKNRVATTEKDKETSLRISLEKKLMDSSHLIVASSPADRAHMVRHYGADPNRIAVVPCGVDLNLFSPRPQEAAKKHLGLSARRVILFVGRIQPIKGLDYLLRALAILVKRPGISSKDLHLLVIGGDLDNGGNGAGGEMEKLKMLTSRLDLDAMVTFLGAQPQYLLPYFYSAAEVCLLPSLYESFGMVALESMACGTPVIASRVGGLNDTVRDGQTGYLIPEGNAVALADKINRLLHDDSLRGLMGRQGPRHAQKYSWENIAHQLIPLYSRISFQKTSVKSEMDLSLPVISRSEIRSCSGY